MNKQNMSAPTSGYEKKPWWLYLFLFNAMQVNALTDANQQFVSRETKNKTREVGNSSSGAFRARWARHLPAAKESQPNPNYTFGGMLLLSSEAAAAAAADADADAAIVALPTLHSASC